MLSGSLAASELLLSVPSRVCRPKPCYQCNLDIQRPGGKRPYHPDLTPQPHGPLELLKGTILFPTQWAGDVAS